MFHRTVSLLRRMVSRPSGSSGALEEDRRAWGRYASTVETTFREVSVAPGEKRPAQVDNISRGGIRLVAPHRPEPGTMLAVDLPGPEGRPPYTVLACVVHVAERGTGLWGLGCTFSQELSDDELRAFGARRARPPAPDDQRTWARFPCRATATYRVPLKPEQPDTPVEVVNVSPTGIGLLAGLEVEMGTLLSLDLNDAEGQPAGTMLACVVHVTPGDGGRWALGCNFIRELSELELNALL
jgi:hypothetical protein